MNRFYLQMHITDRCHGKCKHCYQESHGPNDMDYRPAIFMMKELSFMCVQAGVQSEVAIVGGDPLLHEHFRLITSAAACFCDKVYILGNPEHVNEELIQFLKPLKIGYYQLSLDGGEETHDKLRYRGSYQKTIRAAMMLKANGIKVAIKGTISDINRSEMGEIALASHQIGADVLSFDDCIEEGSECNEGPHCSLGKATLTVLPDLTLMACRRKASSVLGKWSVDNGLEQNFTTNPKMIAYRLIRRIR